MELFETQEDRDNFITSACLLFALIAFLSGPLFAVIVIIVIFLHELGHLIAMRQCGYINASILFQPLGGVATGTPTRRTTFWEDLYISAAGPLPGIILGVILLHMFDGIMEFRVARMTIWVLIGLNGLNLIPVGLFDGGKMFRLFFECWCPRKTAYMEILLGTIFAVLLFGMKFEFLGLFVAFGIFPAFQRLQYLDNKVTRIGKKRNSWKWNPQAALRWIRLSSPPWQSIALFSVQLLLLVLSHFYSRGTTISDFFKPQVRIKFHLFDKMIVVKDWQQPTSGESYRIYKSDSGKATVTIVEALTDSEVSEIAALDAEKLSIFDFRGALDDKMLAQLPWKSVASLDLFDAGITGSGLGTPAKHFSNLSLESEHLEVSELEKFISAAEGLRSLAIKPTPLTEKIISLLNDRSNVVRLSMTIGTVSPSRLPDSVEYLSLQSVSDSTQNLDFLSSMESLRSLELIDFSIQSEDALPPLKLQALESLQLNNSRLGPYAESLISKASSVTLSGRSFTEQIFGVSDRIATKSLQLMEMELTEAGAASLQHLSSIDEIILHSVKLKGQALTYLPKSLSSLTIMYCEPGTSLLLAQLSSLPNLESLYLDQWKITKQDIVGLGNLNKLREVWIDEELYSTFSEEERQSLGFGLNTFD